MLCRSEPTAPDGDVLDLGGLGERKFLDRGEVGSGGEVELGAVDEDFESLGRRGGGRGTDEDIV